MAVDMELFRYLFQNYETVDSLGRRRSWTGPFWRVWKRLDHSAGPDGCWPFTGYRNMHGYGQLSGQSGVLVQAHRIALMSCTLEQIPDGLCVLHACDNPPCCNPKHLRVGTRAENSADMVSRGRQSRMRNELSGKAKLTDAQVAEIRARRAAGELCKTIALDYGVHSAHVSRVTRFLRRPAAVTS